MRVAMLQPGFPAEMPHFTRGLAEVGATVIGVGDQPEAALPDVARRALTRYVQMPNFQDEAAVLEQLETLVTDDKLERIECLWEPLLLLAGRARDRFSLPGMSEAATVPFRDKERMKDMLDQAGIRTPRHGRAANLKECCTHAEAIGFPLVVKPIQGAGSADTYRVESMAELEAKGPQLDHLEEICVEEFIDGEDFTYDTLCIDGEVCFENVGFYRPRALESRLHEWMSPQTFSVRHPEAPSLTPGRDMGQRVLEALDFDTGFTHMEWYRTSSGEAVFGEIAARAPGAYSVDIMNFSVDADLYVGWAEAMCFGRFTQRPTRKYNAGNICKRAKGEGRIRHVVGLQRLMAELGPFLCHIDLLPIGAPRRDWRRTLISDGIIIFRHPNLDSALRIADRLSEELTLIAEP